jgi:hypothetical protein
MVEVRPIQKSLPHELVERFASEVATPGLAIRNGAERRGGCGIEVARSGRVGGRMVRVLIQYAEGPLDP